MPVKTLVLLVLVWLLEIQHSVTAYDQLLVIGAGHGRTGTESLRIALNRLGVGPTYHMSQLIGMDEPARSVGLLETLGLTRGHCDDWVDVANNLTSSESTVKPDWSFLLKDYQSIVDYPGQVFFTQLMEQFPNAKVILTTRKNGHVWWKSAAASFCRTNGVGSLIDQWASAVYRLRPYGRRFFRMHDAAEAEMDRLIPPFAWQRVCAEEDYAVNVYERWNAFVLATVPTERLLVFRTGVDGYAKLAQFLKVPAPADNEAYPRVNSTREFEVFVRIVHATAVMTVLPPLLFLVWLVRRFAKPGASTKLKTS